MNLPQLTGVLSSAYHTRASWSNRLGVLATNSATGQFRISTQGDLDSVQPPLSADMRVTIASHTPAGEFTQEQNGKLERGTGGQSRLDTSFSSVITDPQSRRIIHLNHREKQAIIMPMPEQPTTTPSGGAEPSSLAPAQDLTRENLGERTIAGFIAEGEKIVTPGNEITQFGPVTIEVWKSPELQLPLLIKQTSSGGYTVQEIENVVLGEPSEDRFLPPDDYELIERQLGGLEPVPPGKSVAVPRQE